MRVDGGRPKRISPLVGDTLRWDVLPGGEAVEIKDGAAKAAPEGTRTSS
jgi:TolB protein